MITLEDPGCRPADRLRFHRKPAPPHLVLAFEDVDDDQLGIRVATQDQVAEALAFARKQPGSLLVHCFRGVARSTAVALAILADRLGPGSESEALEQLLALRPEATPNLVVVKLADYLLGRNGSLENAVAAWEATVPTLKEIRETRLGMVHTHPHLYARI